MNWTKILRFVKDYLFQLQALIIKDLKLKSRYKVKFLFSIVVPFTTFIVPLLVFRTLFKAIGNESFGIWNPENYIIFILSGMFIVILVHLLPTYGKNFLREKYWKTLPIIFMSPINVYNLLLSKLLAELIIFIIPLTFIFILCFLITNSSILTICAVIFIYFLAALFIASIGLAIGSFRMSIEGGFTLLFNLVNLFLIFSCYKYPREFFPEIFEYLIVWNPFYYYWDLIRVILVFGFENVIFNSNYIIHFVIISSLSLIGPILSVYFFNYVYKKYGIVGY